MSTGKRDPAASIRARLLNLARERGEEFQGLLTRYGLERLLVRLAQSRFRDRFVLKGAMLFAAWSDEPHRPTRDLDFLGHGDVSEGWLQTVFREICAQRAGEDGIAFDPDSVSVEPIRDDTEYGGMRVTLHGALAGAHLPIQVDIGVGDAVTPGPRSIRFPVLLDGASPDLLSYPPETVVAEKFQAIVAFGIANSRMKDYYDLWVMASRYAFEGDALTRALRNTFDRRDTDLPARAPIGLREAFSGDRQKNAQWAAFLRRTFGEGKTNAPSLPDVCSALDAFIGPPARAAREGANWQASWPPGGPWS